MNEKNVQSLKKKNETSLRMILWNVPNKVLFSLLDVLLPESKRDKAKLQIDYSMNYRMKIRTFK
jgi:hypothetical protein